MKTRFLAVYDYGTGGVWAVIAAASKEEVTGRFPVLTVVDTLPPWMSTAEYDDIAAQLFDIDAPPPEWLGLAMKKRGPSAAKDSG